MFLQITIPKIIVILAATVAIAALSACGSGANEPIQLSGKLVVSSDKAFPEAATARVRMTEHREDGSDKRIVAERTIHHLGRKPITFRIDVAPNLIDANGQYGLSAEIVGANGRVLWHTRWPVDVSPLAKAKPVALELRRALKEADLTFRNYRCADGFRLGAAHTNGGAVVRLGNRRLLLSADPTRDNPGIFSDEHGNRLENSLTRTAFRIDGKEHGDCKAVADEQQSASE